MVRKHRRRIRMFGILVVPSAVLLSLPAYGQQTCEQPWGWDMERPPAGPTDFHYARLLEDRIAQTGANAPRLQALLQALESQVPDHPAAAELFYSILGSPEYWTQDPILFTEEELGWTNGQPPEIAFDADTGTIVSGRGVLDQVAEVAANGGGVRGYPGRDIYWLLLVAPPGGTVARLEATATQGGSLVTTTHDMSVVTWVSPLVMGLLPNQQFSLSGGCPGPHEGALGDAFALIDMDGDGFEDLTEWTGVQDPPEYALLVHSLSLPQDPDPDLVLDVSCHQFFGTCNGYDNGFAELGALDSNQDGVVDATELQGVYLWVDWDGNGKIHPWDMIPDMGIEWDELIPISEMQDRLGWILESIELPTDGSLESTVTVRGFDGSEDSLPIWDWWPTTFRVYPVARQTGGQN